MARAHDPGIVERDVLEELVQLYVLLRVGVDQVVELHSRDRDDRHALELGVIEAVQQMDPARTRCRETAADLAGPFGVPAGHEGRRLLVANLHEPDSVLPDPERLHNAVDTVARQTEDDLDAPSVQRFHENVGRSICHRELPLSERGGCPRNTDVRGGFLRRALPAAAESYCKPTAAPPAGAAARVV